MPEEDSVEVEAVKSFAHGSDRRVGDRFHVSKLHADALVRAGLVRTVTPAASPAPAAAPAATAATAVPARSQPRRPATR